MARFARDCVVKMNKLTKKLESRLGPDTADLKLRVGLHSGAVTVRMYWCSSTSDDCQAVCLTVVRFKCLCHFQAGVLRGENARFQVSFNMYFAWLHLSVICEMLTRFILICLSL